MRLINMTCPNCGSQLQIDADNKQAICQYCGNALLIDDGVQHIQYDNAEEAGYRFEKGRQKAQEEQARQQVYQTSTINYRSQPQNQKKNNNMVWWVLGWIFFFPIPLTILLVRNKTMNPKVKYGIIAGMWIILLLIGMIRNAGNKNATNQTTIQSDNTTESVENSTESISEEAKESYEDPIKAFYDDFSANGTIDNMKDMVEKYGLYVDSKNTGTGHMYYKVAETYDDAKVISNDDAFNGTYFVRIKGTILGDDVVDSVELVDNRNAENDNKEEKSDSETNYAEDELVDKFITDYNSIAKYEITDIEKGNIRTKYFGVTNGCYTEMINSTGAAAGYFWVSIGCGTTDDMTDKMIEVFPDVIRALDSSVSDDEIQNVISEISETNKLVDNTTIGKSINLKFYPFVEDLKGTAKFRMEIEYTP